MLTCTGSKQRQFVKVLTRSSSDMLTTRIALLISCIILRVVKQYRHNELAFDFTSKFTNSVVTTTLHKLEDEV